jgi:hypothetical protein
MPARQKSGATRDDPRDDPCADLCATPADVADGMRTICSRLRFWQVCGRKDCRRAKGCRGDAKACFSRTWPLLPEMVKAAVRAAALAARDNLSKADTALAVSRAMQECDETPPSASGAAVAQPAPQQQPIITRVQPAMPARVRSL